MIRSSALLSVILMFMLVTGCAVKTQRPFPAAVSLQSLAGVVVEKPDGLWFQPCHERLWWPLRDFTGLQELHSLYRQLTPFTQEELYLEFQGGVDPAQDDRLLVKTVDTAGGTSETCHFRLEGLRYRAANGDPFWVADIMTDSVVVKSVRPMGSFIFSTEEETKSENSDDEDLEPDLIALYREKNPTNKPLQIKIFRKRCIDSETSTVLPFTSKMIFLGQRYQGCAREGHPVTEGVRGFYWYQPEGKSQVLFKLNPNQKVQLVTRDSDGKAIIERGSWQYLKSGKLIFSMRDVAQKEYLMLFRRELDGQLVLQAGSDRLANTGATFKLWQPAGLSGGRLLSDVTSDNTVSGLSSRAVGADSDSVVAERGQKDSIRQQPSLTELVLVGSTVQAADIDDELLKEIFVSETDDNTPDRSQ